MKLSVLLSVAVALVSSTQALNIQDLFSRPTVEDAARIARTLINRESLANLNTITQEGEDQGLPVSFVEYYSDCDNDGSLTFLAVNMGTSFKNIEQGSPVTLTIRTGDHGFGEHVDRRYPGSRPNSVAGSPRINLRGRFVEIDQDPVSIEKCFIKRHKDAVWWLPGNPIHKTHFVKFEVEDIYFLGGFGDTGYIGKIPIELYKNAELLDNVGEEGNNLNVVRIHDDDINDWAFKTYMLKHNVMDLTNGFYNKIDSNIQTISDFLQREENQNDEIYLDLSEEESTSSILDLFNSKFSKRDEESSIKFKLNDLSKEQLTDLLKELESLKEKVVDYSNDLITKYELPTDEELNSLTEESTEDAEEEDNTPRYPPRIPARHGSKFREVSEHEGVDPHHSKVKPHHGSKFREVSEHEGVDPHHSKVKPHHGSKFREVSEHEGVDPHHFKFKGIYSYENIQEQEEDSNNKFFHPRKQRNRLSPQIIALGEDVHIIRPLFSNGERVSDIQLSSYGRYHGNDPHHSNVQRSRSSSDVQHSRSSEHGTQFSAIPEHEGVDPHHGGFKNDKPISYFDRFMHFIGLDAKFHDVHHPKDAHHRKDAHHSFKGKFHHGKPHHDLANKVKDTGFSIEVVEPKHENTKSKSTLRINGESNSYRIVENSKAKPGFYSNHELYKSHHDTEVVPESVQDDIVIVVPAKVGQEQQEPKLVNQAAH